METDEAIKAELASRDARIAELEADAEAAMKSLESLQDPSMPSTLLGAIGYMIDHSNQGWSKAGRMKVTFSENELSLWANSPETAAVLQRIADRCQIKGCGVNPETGLMWHVEIELEGR